MLWVLNVASTLPPTSQPRLRRALATWQDWSPAPRRRPVVVSLLHDSGRNASHLVTDGVAHWVLRLTGITPAALAVDPALELTYLRHAAQAGLAPTPSYADTDQGFLVCRYLTPDRAITADDEIQGTARLLRGLHSLTGEGPRLALAARWQHYAGNAPLDTALLHLLAALQQSAEPACFCHNDLLAANRLRHGGVWYALDFEYAAWGDRCFDLAAVIEGDAQSEARCEQMLQAYCTERVLSAAFRERVAAYRAIYRYTVALWGSATERLVASPES